jgi:hypothetical protein
VNRRRSGGDERQHSPEPIGGWFGEPESDEIDPIYDPATGETIAPLAYRR